MIDSIEPGLQCLFLLPVLLVVFENAHALLEHQVASIERTEMLEPVLLLQLLLLELARALLQLLAEFLELLAQGVRVLGVGRDLRVSQAVRGSRTTRIWSRSSRR